MSKGIGVRKFAIGAVIAGIAGYVAGILTAPKSGKETREDIKDNANRVISEAEKKLKKLHSELSVVIEETKQVLSNKTGIAREELEGALKMAKDKQAKVKDLLSALRDGGKSDDPELNKAIKDANAALDHLKKYLK